MMNGIKSTRLVTPQGIRPGCVYWEDGKITEVTEVPLDGMELLDVGDAWVTPGFIDLHTHGGGGGHEFRGSEEDIRIALEFHLSHGTTCIYPTLSSAPLAELVECVERITRTVTNSDLGITVPGVHLEGPYFSMAQMGAQKPKFITPPIREDYLPLLEKYSHQIARWDYAPENDAGQEFAKALKEYGVIAGAGHTDALYSDMKAAMEQKLKIVTHLYSCTSTVTRDHGFRRLGVIETAWLEDDLYVEAIADGKHLPPELLRMIWKLKGSHRVALVTDSILWAGLDTGGQESVQFGEYLIEDGVCKMADRSAFHGSIATTDRLLRNAIDVGCTVAEAVQMLTAVPARILNLPKGKLEARLDADIVVFDDDITVKAVFAQGLRQV